MFGRRIITRLVGAKLPYGTSYSRLRAIHAFPAISKAARCVDGGTDVDQHRRSLLANASRDSGFVTTKRYKSGKKKRKQEQGDEDEFEDENYSEELGDEKGAKVVTKHVSSMRIDQVIKAGIGMSRNKAEMALYESKIRVNGHKITKKSMQVAIGDVIDFVRGPSPKNPDFLLVTRVHVLSAVISGDDGYRIKYTKDTNLVIENYEDAWRPV